MNKKSKPAAVILGLSANGVGAIHSLHSSRRLRPDPILGLDTTSDRVGFRTRLAETRVCPPPHDEGELSAYLLDVAKRIGPSALLVPCSDDYVLFTSRRREELRSAYRFLLPSPQTVESLLDKELFDRVARKEGFPVPRTRILDAAPLESSFDLAFPLVAKPLNTFKTNPLRKALKAREFTSAAEWNRFFEPWEEQSIKVLAQEKIPGDDDDVLFYGAFWNDRSHPVAEFTGRKLRQFPPGYGSTAMAHIEPNQRVLDASRKVLSRLDYQGLVDVEFRYDKRDSSLRLIEINPRQGLWHRGGKGAGVDLIKEALHYFNEDGKLENHSTNQRKRSSSWVYMTRDIRRLKYEERPLKGAFLRIRDYARLPQDALFNWRDPGPFLSELSRLPPLRRLRKKLQSGGDRFRGPAQPGRIEGSAVVLGLTVTGLSVARSLSRKGLNVVATSSHPDPVGAHSRYFDFLQVPERLGEEGAVAFYRRLADQLPAPVVLAPTGDENVRFISRNRESLSDSYTFLIPEDTLLKRLTSKRDLVELSEEFNLPLPRTLLPENIEDLEAGLEQMRFPCVIKPEFTHLWRSSRAQQHGLGRTKAVPAASRDELLEKYRELAAIDRRLIIQQAVLGPDENHFDYHALVEPGGEIKAEFVGQKLRLAPPHFGMGCYVRSVEDDQVLEAGRRIIGNLGFTGMANINFKRDAKDGVLYFFEINPRFSFWTGLDIACGVDFPLYYFYSATGREYSAPASYATGRKWLNLQADRRSMRTYAQDGTWGRLEWLLSILEPHANAVFSWRDPGPSFHSLARQMKNKLRLELGDRLRWAK